MSEDNLDKPKKKYNDNAMSPDQYRKKKQDDKNKMAARRKGK